MSSGLTSGGLTGSSAGGAGGGGVANPLTADLDVDTFAIESTSGDLTLQAIDTAGSDVVLIPDATGFVVVRQDGGTPGTDELQLSHSGTYSLIESQQGQLVLTGSNGSGTTVSIQESGANVCEFKTSINTYKSLVSFNANADIGVGGAYRDLTISGRAITGASTTSKSSLRVPHGSAPTSPVDGDIWTTTAGLYVRINGSTVGPLS